MAKKLLDIKKESKTFTVCPDCNKLYDTTLIILSNPNDNENSGLRCTYIEFPNHLMQNHCNPCGSELLTKIPINNGYI